METPPETREFSVVQQRYGNRTYGERAWTCRAEVQAVEGLASLPSPVLSPLSVWGGVVREAVTATSAVSVGVEGSGWE